MTLTQALIERAHFAALAASSAFIVPSHLMKLFMWRKHVACKAAAVVTYDRAYDRAMVKGVK